MDDEFSIIEAFSIQAAHANGVIMRLVASVKGFNVEVGWRRGRDPNEPMTSNAEDGEIPVLAGKLKSETQS